MKAAKGKVRSELGKRLTVYKTPEITFERDHSVDYGSRIDAILNQIKSVDEQSDAVEDIEDDIEE